MAPWSQGGYRAGAPPRTMFAGTRVARRSARVRLQIAGVLIFLPFVVTPSLLLAMDAPPRAVRELFISAMQMAPQVVMVVFVALCGIFYWKILARRTVSLELVHERIAVNGGRSGTFPLASARVGGWRCPTTGVVSGTALLFSDGTRTLGVAATGYTVPAPFVQHPPIDDVDASISALDFAELLSRTGVVQAARPASAAPDLTRIHLAENISRASTNIRKALPFFVAMGFVALLATGVGTVAGDSPITLSVMPIVSLVIILIGIAFTVVLAMRRRPGLHLDVDGWGLRLVNEAGRVLAEAPLGSVLCERAMWYPPPSRGRRFGPYAVILLRIGARSELAIGVLDARFSWGAVVRSVRAPEHIVSPQELSALLCRLGLERPPATAWYPAVCP